MCKGVKPAIFIINKRYKEQFDEYQKLQINSKLLSEYVFQIILNNAEIKFIKGEYKNFNWNK
jgi:hypothetical protein